MNEKISNFTVQDRQSFIEFVALLRADLISNPENWENKSFEDFFEAMTRYTEDIQGYYDNTKQNIDADTASWKVFADIVRGSAMYE